MKNYKDFLLKLIIKLNDIIYMLFQHLDLKYCFFIPFLLQKMNKDLPEDISIFVEYNFNIFILGVLVLMFLLNILGYVFTIYFIDKYNLTVKYPKLEKLVNYYSKTTNLFIIIESLLCIGLLLCIIIISGLSCWSILLS